MVQSEQVIASNLIIFKFHLSYLSMSNALPRQLKNN